MMIGVFSGADKMLLFLRRAAGFVSLEKDFVQRNSAAERRGAETEKIGGLLLSSPDSPPLGPPVPPLLLSSQRRGAFLQVQIPPIHWTARDRERKRCLPVFHFASLFKSKRQVPTYIVGLLNLFPGFFFCP